MGRLAALIVSLISLTVGLVSSVPIRESVTKLSAVLGLPIGIVGIVAYLLLFAAVVGAALIANFLVLRIMDRRRRRELQETLQKLSVVLPCIESQLARLSKEFSLEVRFDPRAKETLTQSVRMADDVIGTAICFPGLAPIRRNAVAVWTLLLTASRHTNIEVARPFVVSGYQSEARTREMVACGSWGVACVGLLLRQLHESISAASIGGVESA
jgi:hypothetical protein